MSPEQLKVNDRRAFEAVNQKNLAVFDELNAPDMVEHTPSMTLQGLEAFKQGLLMAFAAFPDLHYTIEDQIAEGDTSVTRYTLTGTHQGDFMGIKASGKQIGVTGIIIVRHDANGRALELWTNSDDLGLFQQLGVIPPMPGPAS
jgi:predicted ester cyclase